jgi:hypothetical protein
MLETANRLYREHDDVSIHLYALEHRYYGQSFPTFPNNESPVTNENLVYLSSRQATADLANFLQSQVRPSVPIILFGSSYPGMLAAYTRLKYPHLIRGAISNSAPVQAVLDFTGYNDHVAQDLKTFGGESCLNIVRDAHKTLATCASNPSNFAYLADKFHLCNASSLLDPWNVQMWLGDGVFDLNTQSNDPACTEKYCNLETKCQALISYSAIHNATALETIIWMTEELRQRNGKDDECVELDFEKTVREIADPERGRGWRSWLWQTCTEFGFYQTCELGSQCPFAQGLHPLEQDFMICEIAFGVRSRNIAKNIGATNLWTGGWRMTTSNILSVTGTADPWSELAITSSCRHDVHRVVNASHHYWTHPLLPSDDQEVQKARLVIFETVRKWLLLDEPETMVSSS